MCQKPSCARKAKLPEEGIVFRLFRIKAYNKDFPKRRLQSVHRKPSLESASEIHECRDDQVRSVSQQVLQGRRKIKEKKDNETMWQHDPSQF